MQRYFKTLMEYFQNKKFEREYLSDFALEKDAVWFSNEDILLRYVDFAQHILRLRCIPREIYEEGPAQQEKELDALLQVYNKTIRVVHNQVLQQISEQMFRFALPQRQYLDSIDVSAAAVRDTYARLERLCLLRNDDTCDAL